jgi:molybdopterin synthase sulfur carrier subunit
MIRIVLPYHLRNLAQITGEVQLDVPAPVTITRILDALEARYPQLGGTIRDHGTLKRRPLVRFYVCEEDMTFDNYDKLLPEAIVNGKEPFFVIGAIAGG